MLEHLINADFEPTVFDVAQAKVTPFDKATPDQIIDAQVKTADWLTAELPDDEAVEAQAAAHTARKAFTALTTGSTPASIQTALTEIKTPEAVKHLVGMLTAYDWEFVEQAKSLRGYAVAKILEECENPNANIRLKALGMLGKVTEVGLFTEKIEVKQAPASDAELDARIKEKLARFAGVVDVVDVYKDAEVMDALGKPVENTPETDENQPDEAAPE